MYLPADTPLVACKAVSGVQGPLVLCAPWIFCYILYHHIIRADLSGKIGCCTVSHTYREYWRACLCLCEICSWTFRTVAFCLRAVCISLSLRVSVCLSRINKPKINRFLYCKMWVVTWQKLSWTKPNSVSYLDSACLQKQQREKKTSRQEAMLCYFGGFAEWFSLFHNLLFSVWLYTQIVCDVLALSILIG